MPKPIYLTLIYKANIPDDMNTDEVLKSVLERYKDDWFRMHVTL